MHESKLTDWFPGSVLPVRNGIYETHDPEHDVTYYNYFDNGVWYYGMMDLSVMQSIVNVRRAFNPLPRERVLKWRGLNACPQTGE